jgi:tRNA pseudouridine55 synthase
MEDVAKAAAQWTGPLEQRPPMYSAKKVGGVKAYKAARKGETLQLRMSQVTVHAFEVLAIREGEMEGHPVVDVDVNIRCSKGTYIRSLARDLGESLGVGGTLTALCRVSSGDFHVRDAWHIEDLVGRFNNADPTS